MWKGSTEERAKQGPLTHFPPGLLLSPDSFKQAWGLGVVITYQSVDCECRREQEFQKQVLKRY